MNTSAKRLKIAIVGGGAACLAVLQRFLAHEDVQMPEIVGVADIDERAAGFQFAKQQGIFTTTDYKDLYGLEDLELIIELTGNNEARDAIIGTKPTHIQVIDHVNACFFWQACSYLEDKALLVEELAKTRDFLRTIIDGIGEDILVIDKDLRIVEATESYLRRRELTREQVINKYCFAVFKSLGEPCLLEQGKCPVTSSVDLTETQCKMVKFTDRKGSLRYHEASWYPIENERSDVAYGVKIIRDVTETKILQKRIRESEEEYRKHVSRELHDGIGQALNTMGLYLSLARDGLVENRQAAMEHLSKAELLLEQTVRETDRLAINLRPSALDHLGLIPALRSLCEDFDARTGIRIVLKTSLADKLGNKDVETALYRIVQEGLCNIEKHARATHAVVELKKRDSQVVLRIEDDGSGFDTREASNKGLGLLGMEERTCLFGGNMTLESKENRGTEITIEFLCENLA